MRRLVVVSDRLQCDGLGATLEGVLAGSGGLWFRRARAGADEALWHDGPGYRLAESGGPSVAQARCHEAFVDRALRPAFHGNIQSAHLQRADFAAYRAVNRALAEALAPSLGDDDVVWVHDIAVIPVGATLRRQGYEGPLGFFLHTPFPAPEVIGALPWRRGFAAWLAVYDLIAVQTERDARNLTAFLVDAGGEASPGGLIWHGRAVAIAVHPVAIDTAAWRTLAESEEVGRRVRRLDECRHQTEWLFGCGRLDVSAGIEARLEGYARFLGAASQWQGRISLIEAVMPTTEWPEQRRLRRRVEGLVARINGRFGTFDWMPVRYFYRVLTRGQRAALYRVVRAALVTPLRAGISLTAKEFVASQRRETPGVLLLSRFSGAAAQLSGGVLVNPYDPHDLAHALGRALEMPLDERRARWRAMMRLIEAEDVRDWGERLVGALVDAHRVRSRAAAAA